MTRRFGNTFFTERQVEVLKLRAKGLSLDEIARILGVSKADVSSILKNIERIVSSARETLKLYAELVGEIVLEIDRGRHVVDAIGEILRFADFHGIKLRTSSAELLLELIARYPMCVDMSTKMLVCDIAVTIKLSGDVLISLISKS